MKLKHVLAAGLALALVACGSPKAATTSSPAPSTVAASPAVPAAFPAVVKSCGKDITMAKPPEKVLMMGDTAATVLNELEVLDAVKLRAGTLVEGSFDPAVLAKLKAIPTIKSSELDTGGVKLSTEVVLEAKPDLVLGYDTGIDREALAKAGIPLYVPDAMCADYKVEKADFALVNGEVERIGKLFGISGKAKAVVAKLEAQVAKLKPSNERGTVAVLFITPGAKEFYAYGSSSMVQPIVTVNGLKNVYADQTKRVFETTMEQVLKHNPDYVVLLHMEGTDADAEQTFSTFNGASGLKAVSGKHVIVLPFPLTDPPSPNSIKGAVVLGEKLG